MPQSYLNFELTFTEENGHYWVHASSGNNHAQKKQEFTLPCSEHELEKIIVRLGRSLDIENNSSRDSDDERKFGTQLYEKIFTGQVLRLFDLLRGSTENQGAAIRICLRFSNAPVLIGIPWELMVNDIHEIPFALTTETLLVRKLDIGNSPKLKEAKGILRVLIMVSNPANTSPLNIKEELARINAATKILQDAGRIIVDLVEPSLSALEQKLRHQNNSDESYHIFHFIGHGRFDQKYRNGVIFLEDEQKKPDPIDGDTLGMILYNQKIQLVILNTCQGGRTSLTDPFVGVGQSLLIKGVPAVIAMQFKITDPAAICFAGAFYDALTKGEILEVALGKARLAIYAHPLPLEWATPVLYTRVDDIKLIQNIEPEPERLDKLKHKTDNHYRTIALLLTIPLGLLLVISLWSFSPGHQSNNFNVTGRTIYQGKPESGVLIQLADYPEINGVSEPPNGVFSLKGRVDKTESSVRYLAKKGNENEFLYHKDVFSLHGHQGNIELIFYESRY